jgi:hypothetical protein
VTVRHDRQAGQAMSGGDSLLPGRTVDSVGRHRYVCAAGHRQWCLPCPVCRSQKDAAVRRYFKRMSERILAAAGST